MRRSKEWKVESTTAHFASEYEERLRFTRVLHSRPWQGLSIIYSCPTPESIIPSVIQRSFPYHRQEGGETFLKKLNFFPTFYLPPTRVASFLSLFSSCPAKNSAAMFPHVVVLCTNRSGSFAKGERRRDGTAPSGFRRRRGARTRWNFVRVTEPPRWIFLRVSGLSYEMRLRLNHWSAVARPISLPAFKTRARNELKSTILISFPTFRFYPPGRIFTRVKNIVISSRGDRRATVKY